MRLGLGRRLGLGYSCHMRRFLSQYGRAHARRRLVRRIYHYHDSSDSDTRSLNLKGFAAPGQRRTCPSQWLNGMRCCPFGLSGAAVGDRGHESYKAVCSTLSIFPSIMIIQPHPPSSSHLSLPSFVPAASLSSSPQASPSESASRFLRAICSPPSSSLRVILRVLLFS
jgi:hypothetical protein